MGGIYISRNVESYPTSATRTLEADLALKVGVYYKPHVTQFRNIP